MATETNDFALKEFESLRKEIADGVAETRTLERYAVTATAALWSWMLIQEKIQPWHSPVKWVPLLLSVFLALRSAAILNDILEHARYLRMVEERWGNKEVFGWETHIKGRNWHLAVTATYLIFACSLDVSWLKSVKP